MVSTTAALPKDLETLLQSLPDLSPNGISIIERAYHRAQQAHEGQTRKSGEPYFTHCVAVAGILAEMNLDPEAIAAGLLHDVIEDAPVTADDIRSEFGETVARLVVGVTKLTKLPIEQLGLKSDSNRAARVVNREMEYFRKMLLTMDDDVRVVLVKLADRLHNMRTLGYMPAHKQQRIAQETMDIFAPLANRLGIWQIKWELEDLSFRYLNPDAYRAIARSLDERRADREEYVAKIANLLRTELGQHGILDAAITARPKHIYSIFRKMQRRGVPLEEVYDVRAVRVIVHQPNDCYTVLGIVHRLWHPIPGEFDDYIAAPKDNFYRSLHTAVRDKDGKTLEVQIRTWEMHEDAEYGIAAHWRYKEGRGGGNKDRAFEERVAYLRRLMEFGAGEEDPEAFMKHVQSEVFEDRVYAFTPKGDIIDLPQGATPVDFAYHVHTDVGHRCRGAKVNGKLVSLSYRLQTGDQVEVVTAKRGGPSMDWLNSDSGYVKTGRAKAKIRHWFRRLRREEHISMGREVLERTLKRLGLHDKIAYEAVAHLLNYERVEDFCVAIGAGDVTESQIMQRVLEDERRQRALDNQELQRIKQRNRSSNSTVVDGSNGVTIQGTDGLLVNIARCCNPAPGDEIVGFITRGRGVTVHRVDCPNFHAITDTERLIEVSWGGVTPEHMYAVPIEIVAQDRPGLLRDITTLIADEQINIASVEVDTRTNVAMLYVSLEISDNQQLARVLSRIDCIPHVYEARRVYQS